MWSKRSLIDEALQELALGSGFDITPEEQQTALRRLDTMMATWEAKGIRVGYAFPASPDDSDIDAASGLPDAAVETVYLNLAKRLAPGYGKQLQAATLTAAREGYTTLLRAAAQPQEQQMPNTMPLGAGNRQWGFDLNPFYPTPNTSPLGTTQGGDLSILPE
jgi:hypothetical protein